MLNSLSLITTNETEAEILTGIKVKDEDMDRAFQRIGDQYNMTIAKVKEFFQSRDDLLPFMNEILNEKILNFLRENAKFVDAAPAKKEEKKEEVAEEVKEESAD